MSATEIIAELEKLPESERRIIVDYFRAKEESNAGAGIRYATADEVRKSADKIFERHESLFRRLAQ